MSRLTISTRRRLEVSPRARAALVAERMLVRAAVEHADYWRLRAARLQVELALLRARHRSAPGGLA